MSFFKKYLVLIVITLALTEAGFSEGLSNLPELPLPEIVYQNIPNSKKVEGYVAENESNGEFQAGLFYFYEVINARGNKRPLRKGIQKRYITKAIEYFENAKKSDSKNPYYVGMLGSAYGIRIRFSGFPALLEWSRRCQVNLNEAVDLDPNNPEIRLIRLRSNVHFPYQYYKNLEDEIVEDFKMITQWTDINLNKTSLSKNLKDYFSQTKSEAYFLIGNYYYEQVKKPDIARPYLLKIAKNSIYFKESQKILDEIGHVN